MKKYLLLLLFVVCTICSNAQTKCNQCNGSGKLVCMTCGGSGVVYQQVYNPYYMMYHNVPYTCSGCSGQPVVQCYVCKGYGVLQGFNGGGNYTPTNKNVKVYTESGHCKSTYTIYLHGGKKYIKFDNSWVCIQGKERFYYSGNWYVLR